MGCDRLKEVHDYNDGRMSPGQRDAFEAHLADCPDCARLLHDLRSLSRLIIGARLPEMPSTAASHYYKAWDVAARQRGLLRISSWLTGAAAAVLLGALVLWPQRQTPAPDVAGSNGWEINALMPPSPERPADRPDELIELAQWMADDLSADALR